VFYSVSIDLWAECVDPDLPSVQPGMKPVQRSSKVFRYMPWSFVDKYRSGNLIVTPAIWKCHEFYLVVQRCRPESALKAGSILLRGLIQSQQPNLTLAAVERNTFRDHPYYPNWQVYFTNRWEHTVIDEIDVGSEHSIIWGYEVLVGLQGSCILILDPNRFDLTVGGRRRLFSWTRTMLQLLLDIITYSRLLFSYRLPFKVYY
jgi:hypothetical protein